MGGDTIVGGWVEGGFGDTERFGEDRAACSRARTASPRSPYYVKGPGEERFAALALDVLTDRGREIVEITDVPARPVRRRSGCRPTL